MQPLGKAGKKHMTCDWRNSSPEILCWCIFIVEVNGRPLENSFIMCEELVVGVIVSVDRVFQIEGPETRN